MLAGPHVAVAALVDRTSRRAWIALPLAFVSHYALDALPHSYLSLRESSAFNLRVAIVIADALVGLALLIWIARRQDRWRLILGSAFAATLLDLMNPVSPVGRWLGRTPGPRWLIQMHFRCSSHVPFGHRWALAFGPSVTVFFLAAAATWLLNRKPSGTAVGVS